LSQKKNNKISNNKREEDTILETLNLNEKSLNYFPYTNLNTKITNPGLTDLKTSFQNERLSTYAFIKNCSMSNINFPMIYSTKQYSPEKFKQKIEELRNKKSIIQLKELHKKNVKNIKCYKLESRVNSLMNESQEYINSIYLKIKDKMRKPLKNSSNVLLKKGVRNKLNKNFEMCEKISFDPLIKNYLEKNKTVSNLLLNENKQEGSASKKNLNESKVRKNEGESPFDIKHELLKGGSNAINKLNFGAKNLGVQLDLIKSNLNKSQLIGCHMQKNSKNY